MSGPLTIRLNMHRSEGDLSKCVGGLVGRHANHPLGVSTEHTAHVYQADQCKSP